MKLLRGVFYFIVLMMMTFVLLAGLVSGVDCREFFTYRENICANCHALCHFVVYVLTLYLTTQSQLLPKPYLPRWKDVSLCSFAILF